MIARAWPVAVLTLVALSLAPSYAHVLEAPPRLTDWPASLWIDATVRHGQFALFAIVGGPVDIAAILAAAALAWTLRARPGFRPAAAGAILLALALAVWGLRVAPANAALAEWARGASPAGFAAVRNRWETGHMVVAALKAAGFVAVALAVTARRRF
jgi:hypothetical protein